LLGPCIAAWRFFCGCNFCTNKFSFSTVAEHYNGPFDGCIYWPLFKIDNNHGWNDVRIISFEPGKGYDEDKYEATLVAMLKELGKTISRSIRSNEGAYGVDADDSNYHLVKWTGQPRVIEEDGIIVVGDQPMQVFEGDWVCDGKWLNPVHCAKFWYTVGNIVVTVWMQSVISSNLLMSSVSANNRLPRMGNGAAKKVMQLGPIKLLSRDHDLLMD
jgi:hypothetical protein